MPETPQALTSIVKADPTKIPERYEIFVAILRRSIPPKEGVETSRATKTTANVPNGKHGDPDQCS